MCLWARHFINCRNCACKKYHIALYKVTPAAPTGTTRSCQSVFQPGCCPRCWNKLLCRVRARSHFTLWYRRCAPSKISACAPECCIRLPLRPRNRLFPWRRCSTGCCGTDVPGIRTPTPVSGGSWEQFCQPCPHFRVSLRCCRVVSLWYTSVIHKNKALCQGRVSH